MLAQTERLSSRQFEHIWKRGTSVCGVFVCVKYCTALPQDDRQFAAACIAPKKFLPRATMRNRVRRQLYAALREALQSNPEARKGFLIISVKASVLKKHKEMPDFAELTDDIAQQLIRVTK